MDSLQPNVRARESYL